MNMSSSSSVSAGGGGRGGGSSPPGSGGLGGAISETFHNLFIEIEFPHTLHFIIKRNKEWNKYETIFINLINRLLYPIKTI